MEFFNSLGQVLSNAKNYPAWEQQEKRKSLKQQQLLTENPPSKQQLAEAKEYSRVMVEAINKMDQYSIDKSEDVVSLTQPVLNVTDQVIPLVAAGIGALTLLAKPVRNSCISVADKLRSWASTLDIVKNNSQAKEFIEGPVSEENKIFLVGTAGIFAMEILLSIGLAIADAIIVRGLEKEASRVARFQAREEVLQDPRNFVNYTPEQLAKAEAKAKHSDKKEPKKAKSLNPFVMFGDALTTAKELTEEHKYYVEWKTDFTAKETEALHKIEVETLSDDEKAVAEKDRKRITSVIKQIELKSQQYLANLELVVNLAAPAALAAGLFAGGLVTKAIDVAQNWKWLPSDAESMPLGLGKKAVGWVLPIVGAISVSLYGIKIEKEGAKIGRFKAKQELLKHPEAFIIPNDDQPSTNTTNQKTITLPKEPEKSFFQKVKDEVQFFFHLKKDFDDYEKHEKEVAPKEYQLNEALKKIHITPEQLAEAKKVQSRAFYAFEKIDEKTQRYSDEIEGGTGLVTSGVTNLMALVQAGLIAILTPLFMAKNLEKGTGTEAIGMGTLLTKVVPSGLWVNGLSLLASLPAYATVIWAAQMKKTAAQVGVMLSMKELDDPKRMLVAPSLPLVTTQAKNDEIDDTDDIEAVTPLKQKASTPINDETDDEAVA